MKNKPKRRPIKPFLPWQVDEFERCQEIPHRFPMPFLLLARLLDVSPEQMLRDFVDNICCGSWKREGRDLAKKKLQEYILAHNYGQKFYTPAEITTMFQELDAIGMLFPHNGPEELIDAYCSWREQHERYWFEKWFNKNKREL